MSVALPSTAMTALHWWSYELIIIFAGKQWGAFSGSMLHQQLMRLMSGSHQQLYSTAGFFVLLSGGHDILHLQTGLHPTVCATCPPYNASAWVWSAGNGSMLLSDRYAWCPCGQAWLMHFMRCKEVWPCMLLRQVSPVGRAVATGEACCAGILMC